MVCKNIFIDLVSYICVFRVYCCYEGYNYSSIVFKVGEEVYIDFVYIY